MKKRIAIIVPCFNEEEALPHLASALEKTRASLKNYQTDIIFVNDGSTDNTQYILTDLVLNNPHIYYREFAYNAGHQSALRAGISAASNYDAAIMMDADLQHPPELIPRMIKTWEEGNKIVQMIRKDRVGEIGLLKHITSRGYYYIINRLSDLRLDYGASDFRLIDREVINAIVDSRERDLFLRGYFSWLKVPKATVQYRPNKRIAGSSKYSFGKMIDLAFKGILQFSEKPLQIAVTMGIVLALFAFVYGFVLFIRYFAGSHVVSGWTSQMLTMLFLFGITFIMLGIIGTYLAHLIRIEKQRPEYIIASEKLPK